MNFDKHYTRFSDTTDVITADNMLLARCSVAEIDIKDLMYYPNRLGEILFILCFEGELTFMTGSVEIKLSKGEGFYNLHSDIYQYVSQKDATVYVCSCAAEFFSRLIIDSAAKNAILQKLIYSPIFRFPLEIRQECDYCFELIRAEKHNTSGMFSNECIYALANYLLFHALNFISYTKCDLPPVKNTEGSPGSHFNKFLILLQDNMRKERGLSFYADKLSITPAYLSSVIKRFSGKSGHDYITDMVILEIKNLLKHSELSIKQISFELNFPNPSFMTKFFRLNTGMTPLEYRRKE